MNLLQKSFAQTGTAGKLFLLTLLFVFSLLIFSVLIAFFGLSWDLKLVSAIQTIVVFALPPIVFALLCEGKPMRFLALEKRGKVIDFVIVTAIFIIAMPFMNLVVDWNKNIHFPAGFSQIEKWLQASEKASEMAVNQILDIHSAGGVLVVFVVMALLPAVCEELMFRGALMQTIFRGKNLHLAVWTSAIVFSIIHLQFYGFFPRMLMGAFFAYVVCASDNLRLSIWLHFFNNAAFVLLHFFEKENESLAILNTLGSGKLWWLGVLSGIFTVFATRFFIKKWNFSRTSHNTTTFF